MITLCILGIVLLCLTIYSIVYMGGKDDDLREKVFDRRLS